jgi:hypothetical protein
MGSTYRHHISLRHDRYQLFTSDLHQAPYLIAKSFPPITSCHITTFQRIHSIPGVTPSMEGILSQIQITLSDDTKFTPTYMTPDHTLIFMLRQVTVYPLLVRVVASRTRYVAPPDPPVAPPDLPVASSRVQNTFHR